MPINNIWIGLLLYVKRGENIGIDPHVFMIGGSYKKDADSCKYHVFNMETNISTKTLSQISRLLFPATLVKYQNVMISDIDSIPIPSRFLGTYREDIL